MVWFKTDVEIKPTKKENRPMITSKPIEIKYMLVVLTDSLNWNSGE